MANLYELTGDFIQLQQMLYDGDIDEQTFNDTLETVNYVIEEKADNYAKIMKNIDSDIAGIKAEEKRLADKRKSLEGRKKGLKNNLEHSMKVLGKTKFKTQLFSFRIQKNPAKLVIDYEDKIPQEFYIKQEPKLDNSALKEAIKNGLKIEGVGLIQGEGLRIK